MQKVPSGLESRTEGAFKMEGSMNCAVGLDVGTTTICGCVLDVDKKEVLETWTKEHGFLPARNSWEKIQDPEIILKAAEGILREIREKYGAPSVQSIGLTGQMHGIVYVDTQGKAVSPLYTWQDGRGNQKMGSNPAEICASYAETLSKRTGYPCAAGYGGVTHYYNLQNELVPREAAGFCTISSYLQLCLCGLSKPVVHPSDAAGIGFYQPETGAFDRAAITVAGMKPELFPLVSESFVGKTQDGIPVAVAIGDNQASFLGTVQEPEKSLLVNIGTGSQISAWLPCGSKNGQKELEMRPYLRGDYLTVGSPLCGGRAYAVLEKFFREVVRLGGGPDAPLYSVMNELAEQYREFCEPLTVRTTFSGTRTQPELRGSIAGISTENFTPAHLAAGVLQGCVEELYELYCPMKGRVKRELKYLVGSGNGIRRNKALQNMLADRFRMDLKIPAYAEEAAYGAALFALMLCRGVRAEEIRAFIRYFRAT